MPRAWVPIAIGMGVICLGVGLAWVGAIGPLQACGADGARTCVAWPRPVAVAVLLSYLVLFLGAAVWQTCIWRGSRGA